MTSRQASLLLWHGGKTSCRETQQHRRPCSLRLTITIAVEWANSWYTANAICEQHQGFTLSICGCTTIFRKLPTSIGRLHGQPREFRKGSSLRRAVQIALFLLRRFLLAPRRFFAELEGFSEDLGLGPDASRGPNLSKLVPHRDILPNSYIAYPFANIIYPSDWRFVGPRPVIVVNCARVPPRLILRIYTITEFERGTGHAVCTVALKQTNADMAYVGKPDHDLNDGRYVVSLEDAKSEKTLHATGMQIKRNMNWERRFLQEFDDRIQSPVFNTKRENAPLFSITTTVYNTAPGLLEELFDAIKLQRFENFEWLLLDNASQRSETIQTMDGLARRDSRIRLFRVGKNLKIIGGNRYLLDRARGRYIVPIDSDDLIYPDSLEALAKCCDTPNPPLVLYSDEQKVAPDGTPIELMWRTQWSRASAYETIPAAHLMAFSRERALETKVYGDESAEGCHDWDTVLRLADSGAKPVHVPTVLYGWRMHGGSAAGEEKSKAYLLSSQKTTLEAALHRRNLDERFQVVSASEQLPLGYFHLVRRNVEPPPIEVDFILRSRNQQDLTNLTHNLQAIQYPSKTIRSTP